MPVMVGLPVAFSSFLLLPKLTHFWGQLATEGRMMLRCQQTTHMSFRTSYSSLNEEEISIHLPRPCRLGYTFLVCTFVGMGPHCILIDASICCAFVRTKGPCTDKRANLMRLVVCVHGPLSSNRGILVDVLIRDDLSFFGYQYPLLIYFLGTTTAAEDSARSFDTTHRIKTKARSALKAHQLTIRIGPGRTLERTSLTFEAIPKVIRSFVFLN